MKPYELHGYTKGGHRPPTYQAWRNMLSRCNNPARPDYASYGGRGITVCARWTASFSDFLADMGERPEGHSLDRINNAEGYGPGNCRWASKHEQMQNTRHTRLIEWNGERMGLNAWAKRIGMNKESLRVRLNKGWSVEDALTRPKKGSEQALIALKSPGCEYLYLCD